MINTREATDKLALSTAWQRVFATNNPFEWPFRHGIEACKIFYPTDGYHLTREQFLAIKTAALDSGEDGFFLSIVESEDLSFLERTWGHWTCDHASYEEYIELPLTLENALLSMDGRWGVLVSHEMHAIIGGAEKFLTMLDEQYQGWTNDLRLLREAWLGKPNAHWLDSIISRAQH